MLLRTPEDEGRQCGDSSAAHTAHQSVKSASWERFVGRTTRFRGLRGEHLGQRARWSERRGDNQCLRLHEIGAIREKCCVRGGNGQTWFYRSLSLGRSTLKCN